MTTRFRVWDGEEMHEPPHDWLLTGDKGIVRKDGRLLGESPEQRRVPLFYTGLDDTDGTPIYEGDIIRYWDEQHVVTWSDAGFHWDFGMPAEASWTIEGDVYLLGNRYENPDLLPDTD